MKRSAIITGLCLFSGILFFGTRAVAQEGSTVGPGEVKIFGDIEFVWIPPGTFTMGSKLSPAEILAKYGGEEGYEEHEYDDELPLHRVTLSKGFWMSKYEITNAQYRRFRPKHNSKDYEGHSLNGDQQPVGHTHWTDAEAYCAWLSKEAGGEFRLPTEAEWEYACRAGTETVRYWGDDDASMGQYENVRDRTGDAAFDIEYGRAAETTDGYEVTAPVGSFLANPFGLHDMLGNAGEWVEDCGYANFPFGPRNYSDAAANGIARTPRDCDWRGIRGGNWSFITRTVRSANRNWAVLDVRVDSYGFRVARTLSR